MQVKDQLYSSQKNGEYEEIEFVKLKYAILNNKFKLFGFLLSGFLLAFFIGLQKKTWQGEFQIVVERPNETSTLRSRLSAVNSQFLSLAGIPTGSNNIKTEIEVLKSPSVLMDIFKFVKDNKNLNEIDRNKLRFSSWRNNFNFNLIQETSVLNISYRSKDKELILPVLNKISKVYQAYSGEKKLKKINSALDYYDNQLEIYKEKYNKSIKNVQQFALEYNFPVAPIFASNDSKVDSNYRDFEIFRVNSINEIKVINDQLEKIKNNELNSDQILFLAESVRTEKDSPLEIIKRAKDTKMNIALKKQKFKDEDISIVSLVNEEKTILDEIKKETIKFLNTKKIETESKLTIYNKPDGVIMKYFQLISEAKKEQETLANLEVESRLLSLEKAKSLEPWQLITKPTLLPIPIEPKRKQLLIIGVFLGGVIGILYLRFIEEKKKLILSNNQFISISKWKLLCELSSNNYQSWEEVLKCLTLGIISRNERNISILKVGNFENQIIEELVSVMKNDLAKKSIKVFEDTLEANKFGQIITIAKIGFSSINDIERINQNIDLQNSNVLGSILIT